MNDKARTNRIISNREIRLVSHVRTARLTVALCACASLLVLSGCLSTEKKIAMTLPTIRLESRTSVEQPASDSNTDNLPTNGTVKQETATAASNGSNSNRGNEYSKTETPNQSNSEVLLASYQQDHAQPTHHFPAPRPDPHYVRQNKMPNPLPRNDRLHDARMPQAAPYSTFQQNSRAEYSARQQRHGASASAGFNSDQPNNQQYRSGAQANFSDQSGQTLPPPQSLRHQARQVAPIDDSDQSAIYSMQSGSQSYRSQSSQPLVTGHLSTGMNMSGSRLRQHSLTATDRGLDLLDSNGGLQEKIKALELAQEKTAAELKRQLGLLSEAKAEIKKSNQMNSTLRRMVAELRVENEDLEKEKIAIAAKADQSLSEIEETLDSVLMNSLSNSKNRPGKLGQ